MFKVGDKVVSIAPDTVYSITTEGWKGIVTKITSNLKISVVSTGSNKAPYIVLKRHFKLLEVSLIGTTMEIDIMDDVYTVKILKIVKKGAK